MITLDWLHARTREEDGHLIWTGAMKDGKSPTAQVAGRVHSVRRLVWEVTHNVALGPRIARACCGVHGCVHPDCISAVDASFVQRGILRSKDARMRVALGRRKASKLTDDDIKAIRASDLTQTELATRYGVSQQSISMYRRGVVWLDYTSPFAALIP